VLFPEVLLLSVVSSAVAVVEDPVAVRVREALEAFSRGDFETLGAFLADDVVWHVGGNHQLSGDYQGRVAALAYCAEAFALTSGTLHGEPSEILVSDRYAGVFNHVTGERGVNLAEHPNARRMRDVARSLARGDLEAALQHFPKDVVLFSPATRSEDRVYRGRDGLKRFFGRLRERSNGTITPAVIDVLANDNYTVVFLRVTAVRDGRELDVIVAHFATVGPHGFMRNWFLPSNVAAWSWFFR
jgi:ketosteroid isomerase-like protein